MPGRLCCDTATPVSQHHCPAVCDSCQGSGFPKARTSHLAAPLPPNQDVCVKTQASVLTGSLHGYFPLGKGLSAASTSLSRCFQRQLSCKRSFAPLHAHVPGEERGEQRVPHGGDKGCLALSLSPATGGLSHGGMHQTGVGVLNIKLKTYKEIIIIKKYFQECCRGSCDTPNRTLIFAKNHLPLIRQPYI